MKKREEKHVNARPDLYRKNIFLMENTGKKMDKLLKQQANDLRTDLQSPIW